MTKSERKLRSFEAIQIALAIEDAKQMPTTCTIERQAESLYAAGRRRMAQLRYAENALWPVTIVSGDIRPAILAMSRADVIAASPGCARIIRGCSTRIAIARRSATTI